MTQFVLTGGNYYTHEAQMLYMSASQYKGFKKCEAAELARIQGRWMDEPTQALLVGSYVDAYFSGEMEQFLEAHPHIRNSRTGALKAEYAQAERIIKRIESDKKMMEYLEGEKQRVLSATIGSVPFRIKMDAYLPGVRIVDQKIMRDMEPVYLPGEGRVPFWHAWGYDKSMAIYQHVEAAVSGGDKLPCYLAVATKQEPADLELIELDQQALDDALAEVEADAEYYAAVKKGLVEPERCGKCAYCRATKVIKAPVRSGLIDEEFLF